MNNLEKIAAILRRDSLNMTTAAGSGHPTSCLSCAEIMSVLFFKIMKFNEKDISNNNNDIFILSKGHAAPILYASYYRRRAINKNLLMLRKSGSIYEGHPLPQSFPWARVPTGSLGQGISNAVGIALGLKKRNQNNSVFVLLGDSECAEGSVYEALQLAVHYKLDNLKIIIDINRLGQSQETMLGHDIASYKKRFSSFGAHVLAVNGHNVSELIASLSVVKKNTPLVILAKTIKGKGVSFLENKQGWHGKALTHEQLQTAQLEIPSFSMPKIRFIKPKKLKISTGKRQITRNNYYLGEKIATREAYGRTVSSISDSSLLILDGETSNSTDSYFFARIFPKQYIECFIAEQNMVGMAAGLASIGFKPLVSGFAAFLSRAHDQIRMTALGELPVMFVGSHAGVSIGEDGPSQMALEDISLFRSLPNSVVVYPSDAVSTEKLLFGLFSLNKISYLRTTRPQTPVIYKNSEEFPIGDFKIFSKTASDPTVVVAAGITLHEALLAQKILAEKNVFITVVDCYSIKPFNSAKFKKLFLSKKIIVVEDHYPEGGIGEMLTAKGILLHAHLAIYKIPRSGSKEYQLKIHNINSESIIKSVLQK